MTYILKEIKNNVAILSLNRPDKLNSFHTEMAKMLLAYLDEINNDNSINVVILKAEGKAFCAGQDLQEAIGDNAPSIDSIVRNTYNPIIMKLRQLSKPVIAMVQGVAAGAGANIAFACDIVLAGKSSSFIQAFSKIGLIPDSGGTYILPRLAGGNALALMLTGDRISAEQAKNMNLLYQIFEDENLFEETLIMANKLATLSPTGLRLTKELVNKSWSNSLETQLKLEEEYQKLAGDSQEYRDAVNAFLNKSK
jgi:2-(1,2-epoxy-1,2-dihydrophenyl)acetyl-CoA isomerase